MLTVRKIDLWSFRGKYLTIWLCLALILPTLILKSPTLKIDSYIAVSKQCGALLEKFFAEGMDVINV